MYQLLSPKKLMENGILIFGEYYNGIKILNSQGSISFLRGRVDCIALNVTPFQEDVKITNTTPEITFHDALEKYLSSSKKIKLLHRPTGELCFIGGPNNSLLLCWKIDISAYEGSKTVYINALTGKIESEVSNDRND